jgi:hypothetical protein
MIVDKELMKLADPNRVMNPLERSVVMGAFEAAEKEYLLRSRYTMELVRNRADRRGVDLEAKMFQHLHLAATNLFHHALGAPDSVDTIDRALERLIAEACAVKVIMAEESVKRMMRGSS